MSDPTAETPGAGHAGRPVRETPAGVIGVAFGLALIAALVLLVLGRTARPIDGHALVAASFDLGELPFGLQITGASELTGGERVVRLEVPGAEEPERRAPEPAPGDATGDAPADAPADATGDATGDMDDAQRFDWSKVEEGPPGTPPIRAFLIWYPAGSGERALARQFRDVVWQDLRDFGVKGGRMMTAKGTLDWAGYDAGYVVERELEQGGTFRDWMRVNLSVGGKACVLVARWARGSPCARERVEELLGRLGPRPAGTAGDAPPG
jgi:hypothetical protein